MEDDILYDVEGISKMHSSPDERLAKQFEELAWRLHEQLRDEFRSIREVLKQQTETATYVDSRLNSNPSEKQQQVTDEAEMCMREPLSPRGVITPASQPTQQPPSLPGFNLNSGSRCESHGDTLPGAVPPGPVPVVINAPVFNLTGVMPDAPKAPDNAFNSEAGDDDEWLEHRQVSQVMDLSQAVDGFLPRKDPGSRSAKLKFVKSSTFAVDQSLSNHATNLVIGKEFDWVVCCLIALNALSIGVQTNYKAIEQTDEVPILMRLVELAFCTFFTLELGMRLYVFRRNFWTMPGRGWNWFDFTVVSLQLAEEIANANSSGATDVEVLSLVRMLRLARILRLARVFRLVAELRLLVTSIGNSMRSLIWTGVLLSMMIYAVSLFLTELAAEERIANNTHEGLEVYWGSLYKSMVSLFMAISGGIDWGDLVDPLVTEIHWSLCILMVVYVSFSSLCMMNIVTGIFVESVMKSAKEDKDCTLVDNVREIFGEDCEDMDLENFLAKIKGSEAIMEFLREVGVPMSEVESLFHLLDTDESGKLSADEFLAGCLKLRAPAKCMEAAVILSEVRKISTRLKMVELARVPNSPVKGGQPSRSSRSSGYLTAAKSSTPRSHIWKKEKD